MKEDIVENDDGSVTEVDLRQLGGDVMDMIVEFLRWDRAATERGCYGVILPILMVAASVRTSHTLYRILTETSERISMEEYPMFIESRC